jgi:protoporphyrin/coproporphyrin ferrochelatase
MPEQIPSAALEASLLQEASLPYDALMLVSFGGPEEREHVIPFLENVLRGKPVPRERMLEVAEHYYHFGGRSPINDQNRHLMAALQRELNLRGPHLPVYWGNRNWHPLLVDTLRQMAADGVRRALAFVTSAFSSYSGCRQYREDIERARQEVGPQVPRIDKIRVFYNHPDFIAMLADSVRTALSQVPQEQRASAPVLFTAHSIPLNMARSSDYVRQLEEAARLVAEQAALRDYRLVYQSRSGPPTQPWLEPDVQDAVREWAPANPHARHLVVAPLGFLSDHMEVLYDLDTELKAVCDGLSLHLHRAATVNDDPRFGKLIHELVVERILAEQGLALERRAIGRFGPNHDVCPPDCCPPPTTRPPSLAPPVAPLG